MSLSLTLGLSKFIGILGHHPLFARLLTEDETPQLSPAECNAACLQINQILVNILQNIEIDFGKKSSDYN
ncbi:hypothetical protein H4Q26_017920 [Puccinia striiformis f. sp. tritici PST-130]|nr:hypothetical protein H4Q26_017920 [Puccinia striiformis f. sp. tritici PST-130]